ncbi:hypothetical protein BH23VER1_BH23VER1_12440 [soil metagenome]
MSTPSLLDRIMSDPDLFAGKPVIRGRWLAVDHVLDMLAAPSSPPPTPAR